MTLCRSTKPLKALVFDLDDTLYLQADYKHSGFKAVARWLDEHTNLCQQKCLRDLQNIMQDKGPSHPTIFNDFIRSNQLDPALTQILVNIFVDHNPKIECFSGIRPMLQQLRLSYRLGLLTDGRKSSQQKKIEALNLRTQFDAILLSDNMNLIKPATELFHWFEKQFSLCGSALAYIGDNPHKDFLGANRRGWQTVRVRTGEYRSDQVSGELNANVELPSATALSYWLTTENRSNQSSP